METDSKYKNYSIEDFVQDKDFRDWVLSPNEILNSFWINFQKDYPEKYESIHLAVKIVAAIVYEEEQIGQEQYQGSLNYLKNYLTEKSKQKNIISSILYGWSKVAAILIIPILMTCIYLFLDKNYFNQTSGQLIQYIVPEGQKSNLILADGTKVWLNSGTTLTVSGNNLKNERKVQLSGEAYFDVTKNKKVPFLVETKDYTVKVYGTSFNVRAYDYLKSSETTLKEGSISIITDSKKEIKMVPRQRFLLNSEKTYSLSEVDPNLYTSWKDNVLKIDDERLQDLVVRMEHWYGVNIRVNDFNKVKDLRYTLTIKTESLKEMLELMNYAVPFKYKIEGENVILNYN